MKTIDIWVRDYISHALGTIWYQVVRLYKDKTLEEIKSDMFDRGIDEDIAQLIYNQIEKEKNERE